MASLLPLQSLTVCLRWSVFMRYNSSGVPQRSVLEPILFTFLQSHKSPQITVFVTNSMLTIPSYLLPLTLAILTTTFHSFVVDLSHWLSHNGLCFNPSDAVVLGINYRLYYLPAIHSINIAGTHSQLSNSITIAGPNLYGTTLLRLI